MEEHHATNVDYVGSSPTVTTYASVAQQELEREPSKFRVAGSNPAGCTNIKDEQYEEAKADFIILARCWNWRDNGALEASVRKGVWVRIPPWPLLNKH